jgi:hypothetical protein
VFRESPGGALEAALQIGKVIHLKEFDTTVEQGASCASACAYAWLSGKRRYLEKGSRVGFHAAYQYDSSGNTSITGPGNALIGAYLNGLSLSTEALLYITDAGPTEIRWLDVERANKVGIFAQEGAPDAPLTEQTATVEPQPQPPEQKKQIYERIEPAEISPVPPAFPKPFGPPDEVTTDEPPEPNNRVFTVREGVDVLGLDLWHAQTADQNDCQRQCESALVCRSFTFNVKTRTCYIKQNAQMSYKHVHAVSGYEASLSPGLIEMPFSVLEGVDYPGHDYSELKDTPLGIVSEFVRKTPAALHSLMCNQARTAG